jgi:hypothetical protein
MMMDFGLTKRLRLKTDASVAKSLASRRGLGGIKHIEVHQLWLQERVDNGSIEIEKVKGEINRADALTKYKDGPSIRKHVEWTNQRFENGRHKIMPALTQLDPFDECGEDDNDEEQLECVLNSGTEKLLIGNEAARSQVPGS